MHDDALPDRIAAVRVVADQVVVDRRDVAMPEDRPVISDRDCSSDSSAWRGLRARLVL